MTDEPFNMNLEIGRLIDEFGALESRVRFYCHGAERMVCEALTGWEADPIMRGGDDLTDFVQHFKERLEVFQIKAKEMTP